MKSLRRVLVVHPYGIGDLLFVTPVLRALRLIPTIERVDLLLGSRTDAIVSGNPHVDEIFVVNKDTFQRQSKWKTFQDLRRLGKTLRAKKYDLMLDYSLRGEYAFFGRFFLGISRTAGFDYKRRGFLHSIKYPLPDGFEKRHVVDYFAELAQLAGIPVHDRFLEFFPKKEDRKLAEEYFEKLRLKAIRNYIVVSPGGGESWGKDAHFKRWPVPFFARLAERLQSSFKADAALILGSGNEKQLGEDFVKECKIPALNLCGELPFGVSAVILEKAKLFLGNDGGLMHLARALQTPVVAMFGPVDPSVYGPYPASPDAIAVFKKDLECRPCYHRFRYNAACVNRECLQAFTPEEVMSFLTQHSFFLV